MKQRILDALKTKFSGIGDSILTKVAEKLAKTATTEEEADKAVENYSFSELLESEADRRANEAQKSAVKNYEAKYNLKDGKPVANGETGERKPDSEPKKEDELPAWAKTIMEENKRLSESLENMNKAHVTEGRKAQLSNVIKKLPVSLQKAYERTNLDGTDEEFNTLLGTITTEVEGVLQETRHRGTLFAQPKRGEQTDPSKLTEEQLKAITGKNVDGDGAQPF